MTSQNENLQQQCEQFKLQLTQSNSIEIVRFVFDFLLYPNSRSFNEYKHIQINNIANSMFYFDKNHSKQKHNYSKRLDYSESIFRSASVPILWLDKHGDVHWNYAAQYEILNYTTYINDFIRQNWQNLKNEFS